MSTKRLISLAAIVVAACILAVVIYRTWYRNGQADDYFASKLIAEKQRRAGGALQPPDLSTAPVLPAPMKPRPAITSPKTPGSRATPVVEWCLMTPPLKCDTQNGQEHCYAVDLTAPLNRWSGGCYYYPRDYCEDMKKLEIAKPLAQSPPNPGPTWKRVVVPIQNLMRQQSLSSECISYDDPRLKGNMGLCLMYRAGCCGSPNLPVPYYEMGHGAGPPPPGCAPFCGPNGEPLGFKRPSPVKSPEPQSTTL